MKKQIIMWRVASFGFAALLIFAWEKASNARFISPVFFPAPSRAWESLIFNLQNGELQPKILGTLQHMLFGWFIATVIAIALGAIIGSWKPMRIAFTPTLEFLRPLPVSAVIPVSIAAFGMSNSMATFVIAFGTLWPMLLGTIHGVSDLHPRLIETTRILQMSKLAVIFKVALPAALPDILAGMRVSITVALILSVVCEIVAGLDGLGQWVLISARLFRTADLFAGVILLGVIGYISALLISWLETYMLGWQQRGGR